MRAFLVAHPLLHGDKQRQIKDLASVLRVVVREAAFEAGAQVYAAAIGAEK